MSSLQRHTGVQDSSMENPYLRAYRRESGEQGFGSRGAVRGSLGESTLREYSVTRARHRTPRQRQITLRQCHFTRPQTERIHQFEKGADEFLRSTTPTVGQLIDHTCSVFARRTTPATTQRISLAVAQSEKSARHSVEHEYASQVSDGVYGLLTKEKPDDSIRLMYENFSSLSLFAEGPRRHIKLRHLNKLIREYSVDIIAGCETRTDWRYVDKEDCRFGKLFGDGQPMRGSYAHNTNDPKIKRDQWGGTCIAAIGRFASYVTHTGSDLTSLGRWTWIQVGGGGKVTRIIIAYQPTKPGARTMGETVWDQHTRYFESRGEVRHPRQMFQVDLLNLIRECRNAGEEIILIGDFNENVYEGRLSQKLLHDDIRMSELCLRITGSRLPSTHIRGSVPIDAIYATAGVSGKAVTLLPYRAGVGDHRVFVVDISSESVLGDVFPRVIPASRRLLNCASDRIKASYISVLNQLTDRHRVYQKLLDIHRDSPQMTHSQLQLGMNKVDLELEEFMKSSEKFCHKFNRDNIEWSPQAMVWIHRRWLLKRVQRFLDNKTRDPRNLIRDCLRRGVTNPLIITPEQLRTEFFVCRRNIDLLTKNGPQFRLKHLQELASRSSLQGDLHRAAKITAIIHKEAVRKQWKRINGSTRKARCSLTLRVKIPAEGGGHEEFKTKEGLFTAVSPVLVERFQAALIAPCHRGTFFEDVGHLVDGPVSQQILEGTYTYPEDLDPATRLLFEEAAHTYSTLTPQEIAIYVTPEDFQLFWQKARERTGSSYSGLHFGHYKAASFCPKLSALHAAKLSICARNGVALSRWGIGLTVLLEKIMGNVFVHKLRAICLLEADFNWWNKLIFAKRMMQQAIIDRRIPQECYAKKYSHCNYAVLTKQFFCDSSRVLHHPAGLGECDFGDCYDRAAHPPTSIALQSWGIPKPAIRVLLNTMQTMQYVLKTGFGESTETYGGTVEAPNSGLGQGSGASPPGFLALSSLIVNAYRRLGHGSRVLSSYTRRLFHLTAVIYVDDTDLLHWPSSPYTEPEELVDHVQDSTGDYSQLANASGGILKRHKCSVYFLDYINLKGRFRLKRLNELSPPKCYIREEDVMYPSHITIPQPEGPDLPIVTHDVFTASKMLGVHFSPAGNSSTHVEHMVQKGLDWADCIRTKPVNRNDAWLSFYLQLQPAISWGLVTVCMPPKKLDAQYQRIYAKVLPVLGVNRNIKREWRTLPEQYQGLGMPNVPLLALSEKLTFLVGNWGLTGQAHSDALAMAYENFIIEVGLYGSPLQWSFEDYGNLSTESTWFHNLWQLISLFAIEIAFNEPDMISGIRENDVSLMSEFHRIGYRGKQLIALNIVRRYRNLLHLSDISMSDGFTLDPYILSDMAERSTRLTFPREEPTCSDFALWNEAVRSLCSGSAILPRLLGPYKQTPHLPTEWFTTVDLSDLFYVGRDNISTGTYERYSLRQARMATRHGRKFDWVFREEGNHPGTHFASVSMVGDTCAELHSSASYPRSVMTPTTFMDTLMSYGHCELWDNLSVDDDGEWIREGLARGSLVIAHDGSFMASESTSLCSAGVVFLCTFSRKWLRASLAEQSNCASNYRGELLGAIMTLLLLKAASTHLMPTETVVATLYCDNRGVISHGNSMLLSLPEKQRQADLIRHIKYLSASTKITVKWEWVEGHAVERKGWRRCTIPERLNDVADKLAKAALLLAISEKHGYEGDYPFELVSLKLEGRRINGSPRQALQEQWGYTAAKALFAKKDIIKANNFHLVWWGAVSAAMSSYPKMYRVWITKHVSEFCGTNVQQYYWSKGDFSPKCDFCGDHDEFTTHICRCRDPGRVQMFLISVQEVSTWMDKTLRRPDLSLAVSTYLLGRGLVTMDSCYPHSEGTVLDLVQTTDRLGWDCFLEGRISRAWTPVVSQILATNGSQLLADSWGKQFITKLLNIVHKQWIYRNTLIHYRGLDGFTIPEHHEICNRVEEYAAIDPETILPRHQYLFDTDFETLGSGPTSHRLLWLAEMDTAISVSTLSTSGGLTRAAQEYFSLPQTGRAATRSDHSVTDQTVNCTSRYE